MEPSKFAINPETRVELPGYCGAFESVGKGKGLAAYHKGAVVKCKTSAEGLSAIKLNIQTIEIIFLYLSSNTEWKGIKALLESWISPSVPTLIMGDMNWHWTQDSKHPMKTFLHGKGLKQLMKHPTHDQGHCLDHIYMNDSLEQLEPQIETQSPYYSDHDILSIYFQTIPSQ